MSLLFYTAADESYEYLAPLYIHFALRSNPDAYVEIGLEDPERYKRENERALEILSDAHGDRFRFKSVNFDGVLPGAVRFVTEPSLAKKCDYVYIGDIDILLFDDDIEEKHLKNMSEHDAPFSNMIRDGQATNSSNPRLTGLHFAPTDVQYPLPDLDGIDYSAENTTVGADETALFEIMERQGVMISRDMDYRPEHGIHMRTHNHPFGRCRDGGKPDFSFEEIRRGNRSSPWYGLEKPEYRQRFMELTQEAEFQDLYFNLDIKAKNLINILENACSGRFDEFEKEAYTYIIAESRRRELLRKTSQSFREDGATKTLAGKIVPRLLNRIGSPF